MLLDLQESTEEAGDIRHSSNAMFPSAEDSMSCSASAPGLRLPEGHSRVSGHSKEKVGMDCSSWMRKQEPDKYLLHCRTPLRMQELAASAAHCNSHSFPRAAMP